MNWEVLPEEHHAYAASFQKFLAHFGSEILESNVIPPEAWEYRTAAHHSGTAHRFLGESWSVELPFFSVMNLGNAFVCDASLLRAGGIANSGLTLVALSHRLAELAKANF